MVLNYANRPQGITVGAVVVPQGMAYALLAKVPVQFGLYSSFMGKWKPSITIGVLTNQIQVWLSTGSSLLLRILPLAYVIPLSGLNIRSTDLLACRCHVHNCRQRRVKGTGYQSRDRWTCYCLGSGRHLWMYHCLHRPHSHGLDC